MSIYAFPDKHQACVLEEIATKFKIELLETHPLQGVNLQEAMRGESDVRYSNIVYI